MCKPEDWALLGCKVDVSLQRIRDMSKKRTKKTTVKELTIRITQRDKRLVEM